jgi:hypothetical protein
MALWVRLDAITALRAASPPANFCRWRICDTPLGATSVASLAEGEAFHMARSAPSVGAATAGTLVETVASALAMAGKPPDTMQTNNPVRI